MKNEHSFFVGFFSFAPFCFSFLSYNILMASQLGHRGVISLPTPCGSLQHGEVHDGCGADGCPGSGRETRTVAPLSTLASSGVNPRGDIGKQDPKILCKAGIKPLIFIIPRGLKLEEAIWPRCACPTRPLTLGAENGPCFVAAAPVLTDPGPHLIYLMSGYFHRLWWFLIIVNVRGAH